jgi:hypothetical protein
LFRSLYVAVCSSDYQPVWLKFAEHSAPVATAFHGTCVIENQVHGAYEEDKLESQLQKLRDDLFVREPHLAELLLLDSIGASIDEQELIPKQFV